MKRRSISIDNAIFRCHWFFTSTLLVSFSLVITARQYVGQPIECHSVNKIPDSLLNSYCWVQSTFSVPQACNQQVGIEVPYPCIDNTRGREVKMFAYYQWVGMVLFIQGLLFHLPYYLWKVWENGLIRAITGGLRVAVLSDQEREKKKEIVIEYIYDHLGCHKRYAFKYFLCEFICLINLLGQLWATNRFFDGQFLRYGLDVVQYSSSSISSQFDPTKTSSTNSMSLPLQQQQQQTNSSSPSSTLPNPTSHRMKNQLSSGRSTAMIDPMTYIFPRITKCTYYDFGSSGDVQKHDALCLLPLNIINEKIYIALWFWFLILALLTFIVIIYRLLAIFSGEVRCKGLISRCKLASERHIRIICRHCDVGDWFLFYMVAENLDPLVMREIVAAVAIRIQEHFDINSKFAQMREDDLDSTFKAATELPHRTRPYETDSLATTRQNSISDEIPLVKKVKKKLYSKRLWSIDLGSGELRQSLFGRQPPLNPDVSCEQQLGIQPYIYPGVEESRTLIVSAPPADMMQLESVPDRDLGETLIKTNSIAGGTPNANSFVMEMQTLSGPTTPQSSSATQPERLKRRLSANQHSLLRQRSLHRQHTHHQSITSIRELRLDSFDVPVNYSAFEAA